MKASRNVSTFISSLDQDYCRKKWKTGEQEKSRNGDTLGPVELIVWPAEQGNQGDWREQDDQGDVIEVSIITFGMSTGFQE